MKFGTDGIRGVAGIELTPEVAMRLGFHAARLLSKGTRGERAKFAIGKDPRMSSDMLEAALCSGVMLAGANPALLGVVSTPAVPFALRENGFAGGFMITASHNPIEDNGIKVFGGDGLKLSEQLESKIEIGLSAKLDYTDSQSPFYGRTLKDSTSRRKYVKFLRDALRRAGWNSRANAKGNRLKIVFDCAYGATSELCREVFSGFDADFSFINAEFDGKRINLKCGATDLSSLKRNVKKSGANFGVAFDGDGDRALIVDSAGREVDGDRILGIMAVNVPRYKKSGCVVATVMSNFGLEEFLSRNGLNLMRVPVGDKYVLQKLIETGLLLGGEQSGHIVMLDKAHAGDGLLTAAAIIGIVQSTGKSIEELSDGIRKYPQILTNVRVESKSGWDTDAMVKKSLAAIDSKMKERGRLLVRPSGTEPVIRVMVESPSRSIAKIAVDEASSVIRAWDARRHGAGKARSTR